MEPYTPISYVISLTAMGPKIACLVVRENAADGVDADDGPLLLFFAQLLLGGGRYYYCAHLA